jgi:hypothetical protein
MRRCNSTSIPVLNFLRAPRLVVLDLDLAGGGLSDRTEYCIYPPSRTLHDFLLESDCQETFQSFRLANAWVNTQYLLELFRYTLLQSVVHLTLEEVSFIDSDGDGYWALYECLSSPSKLPKLETLQLLLLPQTCHFLEYFWNFLRLRQPLEICDGKAVFPREKLGASLIKSLVFTFKQATPGDAPVTPQRIFSNRDDMKLVREWRRYANMLVSIGPLSTRT